MEISIKRPTPPPVMETKYEIRVTELILFDMGNFFLCQQTNVMAFLCFISDSQLVEMSGGEGGHFLVENKFVFKCFIGNFKCFSAFF